MSTTIVEQILTHPIGSPTFPNGTLIPAACENQRVLYEQYKKLVEQGAEVHQVPLPGGYGTHSPIRSECVSCPGTLQCFARMSGTPVEVINAALEKLGKTKKKA